MFTKSITSLHRFSGCVLTLLLLAFVSIGAGAQTTPLVTASFATGLNHPSGWGTLLQTAMDTYGDWLVVDYPNGALYEFPAGGGPVITLLPAPSLAGGGGYSNPSIAIDGNNNLYLGGNWNNCLEVYPYDPATKTWDGLININASTGTSLNPVSSQTVCPNGGGGTSPYLFAQYGLSPGVPPGYFQPWGVAVGPGNNSLAVASQNSGNFIFTLGVNNTTSPPTHGTATAILLAMTKRANSIAEDKWGNIYFVEDSGGLSGVYEIPAGETSVAADTDPSIVRVDPTLPSVTGVITDPNGNLYISDSSKGVFMVPNVAGTPNPSAAVMMTPVPAVGEVSIDWTRDIMYVPTSQTQSNGQADVAEVTFNSAELGSVAAGSAAASSQSVTFNFNGSATPGTIAIEEAGAATPDFVIASGGTCAVGTTYTANSSCTVNVTLSPHAAGSVSAKLVMLDSSGNVLASMPLHGTGNGSAVRIIPGAESAIGSGLHTPSEVAVDANGDTFVADSGLGAVEMYAKGSSSATTVGTGLSAPTGVAVDGAGDVFIADSGNVIEVPEGPTGLDAAGQATIATGLGSNVKLATDGLGDVYASDPDNHQVVKLTNIGGTVGVWNQTQTDITGFNAPSALATDASGNLYVADGSNLIEVSPGGTLTTLLSSLNNPTGLAIDASGSVYVTMTGGTAFIPNESGTLNPADQIAIAPDVTSPASVAVDASGNLYIADATAEDVDFVSVDASINFGTLATPSDSASQGITLVNIGNLPLNITGFTGTADFSETATTCTGNGAIAVGATCSATITFSPGPGDQGSLQGEVVIDSDAANSPVGVNAVGVGATLAASTTTATITNATVDGVSVNITVAPASGTTPVPTGQVTVNVTGNGITPVNMSGTLTNGMVTITVTQLPAGTYQFVVSYQGDRTYANSSTTLSANVGAGAVTLTQPTLADVQQADPAYPYVLAGGSGSNEPYDGSVSQFEYTSYTVHIIPTDGAPLIGVPVYDSTGKLITMNYGSVTFQGASSSCAPVPVASDGTAAFNTTCLTIDTTNTSIPNITTDYTITPEYSPAGTGEAAGSTNPNYTSVTGTAISFTALRNPLVTISSSPSALTISAGSSATATLTLSSLLGYGVAGANGLLNNYSLPVQLACDGLPAYATCTFTYPTPDPTDPQSVDVGPAPGTNLSFEGGTAGPCTAAQNCFGPGTVIMTITTSVPPGVASLHRGPSTTEFAAMFGLGLLAFAFGKRRSLRGRILTLTCLLLCCGIMAGISGCSTKQLGVTNGTPTPKGTYQVQVTAKQVGSQVITQNPYIVYGNGNQMSLPFTMQVTIQ